LLKHGTFVVIVSLHLCLDYTYYMMLHTQN
jgi:hypothetical protein